MNYLEQYEKWKTFDNETSIVLNQLKDNKEIYDRFYQDIPFGTGGIRGLMGAGTNRINKYTIAKAAKGFCDYLLTNYGVMAQNRGILISYDNRNYSKEFAEVASNVITSLGIKVYIFDALNPTPVLSFGVKHLNCVGGIMITASHNSKEYNGFKVYNEYGCQLVPNDTNLVISYIKEISEPQKLNIKGNKKLLTVIGKDIIEEYYQAILKQQLYLGKKNLKIVYTPLHGTGNIPIREVLNRAGFTNVHIVQLQEFPDGNFPTIEIPNPEEKEALSLGIEYAKSLNADIVLATDPDCDRIGIAVLHHGEYVLLTGNQVGALLIDYIISNKNDIENNSVVLKTIVTNELGAEIAKKRGIKILETLTGFKYIGEKIIDFEKGNKLNFLFGYEESYGYLLGSHAKDKDGVIAAMVIAEMTEIHKKAGITLVDRLEMLYKIHGYYCDDLLSFTVEGINGKIQITEIMSKVRNEAYSVIPQISRIIDYALGIDGLPKSDVIKLVLNDGSWLSVRPSGTESKIKFYFSIKGKDQNIAEKRLIILQQIIYQWLNIEKNN